MSKIFGLYYVFLYFYWVILLRLSPEMWIFTYSGIMWDYCEGISCSSLLGEASIAESRLTLVGSFTLLK